MKHLFTLLFFSLILNNTKAQDLTLKVNWQIRDLTAPTSNTYTLKKGTNYSVKSFCTNFCARNTFTWSVVPTEGCNFSSTTVEEPTMIFTKAGTYTVKLRVNTVSAPGWLCVTDQKEKYYIIYVN